MITSGILVIIFGSLNYLVAFLPNVSDTGVFSSAMTTASTYISAVYNFAPLITTTVLAIFAFDIVFETAYLLYKVIYWIIRRFPTQS
jgi:hypothetical protein